MDSPSVGTLAELPLDQLHDSPFQPRSVYVGLEGLAESIKIDGVQQPLKVRPRSNPHLAPHHAALEQPEYELIFGHRRKRAAELAGLQTVPCLVVAMSDAEVRSAQMAENLQRDNMRALEEAAGYEAQIEKDGISQAELARRLGKSGSHVAGRLRLLQLTSSVRDALQEGRIGAEVALLIARVGPTVVQQKALAAIESNHMRRDLEDGGSKSLRAVRNLLAEKFTLDLKKALFAPENADLLPAAGACTTCPKRSGNAAEFEDIAFHDTRKDQYGMHVDYLPKCGPDICTDPDCHEAKTKRHLALQAEALAAEGKEVVSGAKARQAVDAHGTVKGAYVAASEVKAELAKVRKEIIKKGELPPKLVTIQDPRTGKTVQAYRREELQSAGLLAPATAEKKTPDYDAMRRADEAKCKIETAARRRVLQAVRAAARQRPRDRADLVLMAQHMWKRVPDHDQALLLAELWDCASPGILVDSIDEMTSDELALLMMDIALVDDDVVIDWVGQIKSPPEILLGAADRYGVDAEAARAEPAVTDAGSTPSTAARAQKSGAGRPTKGVRYRCPDTLQTWSGRGLKPKWMRAALDSGRTLAELEVKDDAHSAGEDQKDDAGVAGDLFDEAAA